MVTWPMTSRDLERPNSWSQYASSAISRKLLELETSNLVCNFVWECRAGVQIIFPQSGRGLGHATPTILAYDRTYLQNYLSYRLHVWYTALYGKMFNVSRQSIFAMTIHSSFLKLLLGPCCCLLNILDLKWESCIPYAKQVIKQQI